MPPATERHLGVLPRSGKLGGSTPPAAVVDSVVAGGVRLWLFTNPRDGYEAANFSGLTTAPCLPKQAELRHALLQIAAAANEQPYQGRLPTTAGRFSVNSDAGMFLTDPGDQHLIQVAERVLGRAVVVPTLGAPTLDGALTWIYTETPPYGTDSVQLAAPNQEDLSRTPQISAGGLEVIVWVQASGGPGELTATTVDEVARIAEELNRDPLLGQALS
jgi:hypothetical protein